MRGGGWHPRSQPSLPGMGVAPNPALKILMRRRTVGRRKVAAKFLGEKCTYPASVPPLFGAAGLTPLPIPLVATIKIVALPFISSIFSHCSRRGGNIAFPSRTLLFFPISQSLFPPFLSAIRLTLSVAGGGGGDATIKPNRRKKREDGASAASFFCRHRQQSSFFLSFYFTLVAVTKKRARGREEKKKRKRSLPSPPPLLPSFKSEEEGEKLSFLTETGKESGNKREGEGREVRCTAASGFWNKGGTGGPSCSFNPSHPTRLFFFFLVEFELVAN